MTHREWLELMKFPSQWLVWDLIPTQLAELQLARYEIGNEQGSEHDRHGAFQWWLQREPSEAVLIKLARLTWLDPDEPMGGYVRECIAALGKPGPELAAALKERYAP